MRRLLTAMLLFACLHSWAAAILEVKGTRQTTYLYVGDRWMDPDLSRTKTIVFPVFFDDTRCLFDYRDRFSINFTTGERRDTP